MKRGQSRFPPDNLRMKEEDIMQDGGSSPRSGGGQTDDNEGDNYQQNVELRNKQYAETKDFGENNDEENDNDDYENEQERQVKIFKLF